MHVVFRESHGLETADTPYDPGQDPADLVVLSFSDSDLGAFAAGWHRAGGTLPPTRLQNIVALRHPVSVDTYLDRTLSGARAILIRLIGGEAYWPYGIASIRDLAQRKGLALAILPADGRPDPALDAASTLPVSTLRRLQALCDAGGRWRHRRRSRNWRWRRASMPPRFPATSGCPISASTTLSLA